CQPTPTPQPTPTQVSATPTLARATSTPTGPVVKIAVHVALTGEQRELGEAIRNAAQLAVKQNSKPISDLGYAVVVVPYDDQTKIETGVSNAKKLVADSDTMVVIGHLNSAVTFAALDIYRDANLALVSPANTEPRLTARGLAVMNRVIGRDDMQGPAGAELAAKEFKAKTAYVIYDQTSFGTSAALGFKNRATQLGVNVVGFDALTDRNALDAIGNAIKTANPDLIYFSGLYDLAASFMKIIRAKGIKANVLAPEIIDTADFARLGGDDAVNVYYTTPVGQAANYPDADKFARDYRAEYGKNAEAYAAQAYDATNLALKAIALVMQGGKKPERKAIADAIRATKDYKGVTGTITFDANGDLTSAKYFFFQVNSADPQKWLENKLSKTLELAPTLP
ncbi:MAG: branched-chain amino acid ABC transporter substrate-binding protein, partial [Chloroflexi bacterium]|nr:branched-chain amino acid ABC transporter substrate-binding protein [Chloroflexota bacterium]